MGRITVGLQYDGRLLVDPQDFREGEQANQTREREDENLSSPQRLKGGEINNASLNLCGLRRENENKEDFFFHLLHGGFASLRSLAHPRDKPENPRGLPIRKSRGYSSPYSNRSVDCSFWSHKGRTGRKAVIFAHTDIA